MAKKQKPLTVYADKDESKAGSMARVMIEPYLRHGMLADALTDKSVGKLPGEPQVKDFTQAIRSKVRQTRKGELGMSSDLLTVQALSLDGMMTELMRRSIMNFGIIRWQRNATLRTAGIQSTVEQPCNIGGFGQTAPAARANRSARSHEPRWAGRRG